MDVGVTRSLRLDKPAISLSAQLVREQVGDEIGCDVYAACGYGLSLSHDFACLALLVLYAFHLDGGLLAGYSRWSDDVLDALDGALFRNSCGGAI